MKLVKIGLLREGKVPPDKRVPFTPNQVVEILQRYPQVSMVVQKSTARCFKDEEYNAVGVEVKENLDDCDILMGIKEAPLNTLIEDKTYLFFSHTIKEQPYNRQLLQDVIQKKIRLIDYEVLKDTQGNRLVAFGRYAGLVGAYNALWAYGEKYKFFALRRAHECFDVNDLKIELRKVSLPPLKIILTGGGRVGKGAMETLDSAGIRKITPADFLTNTYNAPVYVQLASADYHYRIEGGHFNREEFHQHPERYGSFFLNFVKKADVLIAGAYWNPKAPVLFTRTNMLNVDFRIKIIADISCDINGSIPATKRASSILNPLYDYDPVTDTTQDPLSNDQYTTIMAIDNLPCELPRSASEEFGRDLIDKILRPLLIYDAEGIIERGTIAKDGSLTPMFNYLSDYVSKRVD